MQNCDFFKVIRASSGPEWEHISPNNLTVGISSSLVALECLPHSGWCVLWPWVRSFSFIVFEHPPPLNLSSFIVYRFLFGLSYFFGFCLFLAALWMFCPRNRKTPKAEKGKNNGKQAKMMKK